MTLSSCQLPFGNKADAVIYDKNNAPTIVYADNQPIQSELNSLFAAISDATGTTPEFTSSDAINPQHEIVVGNTAREISATAYRKLSSVGGANDGDSFSFLIYSNGTSVAIAYEIAEDEIFDAHIVGKAAINYFIENHVKESLVLADGYTYSETISLTEYYAALDAERKAARWEAKAAMDEEYGDEIVEGLKGLYTLYTPGMITWLAELYDPGIGGYYYSNSGRDNYGFLPDLESTAQALSLIRNSGILDYIDKSVSGALPKGMKDQMVYFAKSLQDPGGYFYHPQWGTSITSSRRSRDITNAMSVLEAFGRKPTYKTPNGDPGDGIKADGTHVSYISNLPEKLGTGTVIAVSKVIATATATDYPKELENDVTFKEYLAGLDIENKSYNVGSTLTAMMEQIKYRDKTLKAEGADYSLVKILIDWLNENQNPKNGTWHGETNYFAMNGLMKISGIYSKAGVLLPNVDKAIETTLASIISDEEIKNIVDIYNPWSTIVTLLGQIRKYGTDDQKELATSVKTTIRSTAKEALEATTKKVAKFKKDDGSFSYNLTSSSSTSQGAPVAVANTNEGDMNATLLASVYLHQQIYPALQLGSEVSMFGHSEWRTFISITNSLNPLNKAPLPISTDPYTFDDEAVGAESEDINCSLTSTSSANGGYIRVTPDEREGHTGNVLKISSKSGGRDYVSLRVSGGDQTLSCNVFEADMCLLSSSENYAVQVQMGTAYLFTLRTQNGKVNIVESSSTEDAKSKNTVLDLRPQFGEWFNIRVEYYTGNRDTVRIKFYYNDKLVAVTDNFYNSNGKKLTDETVNPSSTYTTAYVYVMKSAECELLLDNIAAYKSDKLYEAVTDLYNQPNINIDAPPAPDDPAADYSYYANTDIEGTRYNFSEKLGANAFCKVSEMTNSTTGEKYPEASKATIAKNTPLGKLLFNFESTWQKAEFVNQSSQNIAENQMLVFETEFTFIGGYQTDAQISSGLAFLGFFGEHMTTGETYMSKYNTLNFIPDDPDAILWCGVRLEKGVTYNIRMEYIPDGDCYMYVDNELVECSKFSVGSKSDKTKYQSFGFYFRTGFTEAISFSMDNVFLGVVDIPE